LIPRQEKKPKEKDERKSRKKKPKEKDKRKRQKKPKTQMKKSVVPDGYFYGFGYCGDFTVYVDYPQSYIEIGKSMFGTYDENYDYKLRFNFKKNVDFEVLGDGRQSRFELVETVQKKLNDYMVREEVHEQIVKKDMLTFVTELIPFLDENYHAGNPLHEKLVNFRNEKLLTNLCANSSLTFKQNYRTYFELLKNYYDGGFDYWYDYRIDFSFEKDFRFYVAGDKKMEMVDIVKQKVNDYVSCEKVKGFIERKDIYRFCLELIPLLEN